MANRQPFRTDPSATSAFSAIRDQLSQSDANPASHDRLKAVVIGGGTGAPMSIRTLLSLGVETSAVVAMADDGGSTGILRDEADVTPPGDVRKCIVAFARNPQDPLVKAFRYRIAAARDHALGNLLLSALEDASGSFPEAIAICERLVDARGHVYPSTLDHVTLMAKTRDGRTLDSQALACHSKTALESVWLQTPDDTQVHAYEPALQALRQADLIVLGPGSLFTSIIPNLLIPGVIDAIRQSHGHVIFVCSLADIQGETWGLTAREHVEALFDHGMEGLIDYALVHTDEPVRAENMAEEHFDAVVGGEPENTQDALLNDTDFSQNVRPVAINYQDLMALQAHGVVVLTRDLANQEHPAWHDPLAMREAFEQVINLSAQRKG